MKRRVNLAGHGNTLALNEAHATSRWKNPAPVEFFFVEDQILSKKITISISSLAKFPLDGDPACIPRKIANKIHQAKNSQFPPPTESLLCALLFESDIQTRLSPVSFKIPLKPGECAPGQQQFHRSFPCLPFL